MASYDPKKIEPKWQRVWEETGANRALDPSETNKPKYYALIEFPYPSGDGLHVGHPRPYIALDIIARKKRGEGFNVLYPIGWDAFGLPTENYAVKTGIHPAVVTKKNSENFKRQIKMLGLSFDWSREINTTDPKYYKWTQWIFLQFFKKGLAYKAKSFINWCPSCKIGLANEEAIGGVCERCGGPTEKREKEQWMLAITKYADRLDKDLDTVDYLEKIKIQQRNWIGKSEGAEISFPLNKKYTFVLLHGFHGHPTSVFFPWLKAKLEADGHKVIVPQLPNTEHPTEDEQVESALAAADYDENTILYGHSLGSVVALKVAEKLQRKIAGLVLSGSFVDPQFKDQSRNFEHTFTWKFDVEKIKNICPTITLVHDIHDSAISIDQAKRVSALLSVPLMEVVARGPHFDGKEEPELLNALRPSIKVFTTRTDTIFGATYLVVAPEHTIIPELKDSIGNWKEVVDYIAKAAKKTELERTAEGKEKTGVELKGVKAINPASGQEIPVFVADYVLAHYGTGAIMAVPAHDERDFEFAKKFGLPIKQVVAPYVVVTGEDAPRSEKNIFKFNAASVVIKHWEKDLYYIVQFSPTLHGIVGGHVEEGETPRETALRELTEESGYSDIKSITPVLEYAYSRGYKNRKSREEECCDSAFFAELGSGTRVEIVDRETKHGSWMTLEEIFNLKTLLGHHRLYIEIALHSKPFVGDGVLVNSSEFDGIPSADAREKITEKFGTKKITYKLRDWIFSRQRYWGEPIPLIWCEKDGWVAVPDDELPVELPDVKEFKPRDDGQSPLASVASFVNTKCPQCGGPGKRETDTMPNWAGSSWYYLRYVDPHNDQEFASQENLDYWDADVSRQGLALPREARRSPLAAGPVDWYNGGMEHTTLHLLYSRFWHKFLFDLGLVPTSEPYQKRTSHGLILAGDGSKMSKSKGNVVNPDELVERFGADSVRLYEMFMGPFDQAISWNTDGVVGMRRFLERVWKFAERSEDSPRSDLSPRSSRSDLGESPADQARLNLGSPELRFNLASLLHQTIKKVSEDIESLKMNTAVSSLMVLFNAIEKAASDREDSEASPRYERFKIFVRLLAPFAPHLAEELWDKMGGEGSVHAAAWPQFDETKITAETVKIVVQIDGKTRGAVELHAGASQQEAADAAREAFPERLGTTEVVRVIYVPQRLINFVIART